MSQYLEALRSQIGHRLLLLPCVAAVIHDDQGRILLLQESAGAAWSLPGGAIEPGEEPQDALRRAAREHAGLSVEPEHLLGVLGGEEFRCIDRDGNFVEHNVVLYRCKAAPQPTDGASPQTLRYCNANQLPALALPYPSSLLFQKPPATPKPQPSKSTGWWAAAALVALVLLLGLQYRASEQQRKTTEQRRIATSQLLALQSKSLSDPSQRTQSLLLAALALTVADTPQARGRALDLISGEYRSHRPLLVNSKGIDQLVYSPDGMRMASSSWDNTLRLWDPRSGKQIGAPLLTNSSCHALAFSVDGTRLAGCNDDKRIQLWESRGGQSLGAPFQAGHRVLNSLAFSPDGTRIISDGYNGEVQIWEVSSGSVIQTLIGGQQEFAKVAFSANGARIYGYDRQTLHVWDGRTAEPLATPPLPSLRLVALSPDGTRIVSHEQQRWPRVLLVNDGRQTGDALDQESALMSAAFSQDGKLIVTGDVDGVVRLWNARGLRTTLPPHDGSYMRAVAISPDRSRIVTGSQDGTLRLWTENRSDPLGMPLWPVDEVSMRAVSISPDGRRIVGAGTDMALHLWDTETGRPIGAPQRGHTRAINTVAFSPDGTRIVTGSDDYTLRLWDGHTAEPVGNPLRGHDLAVYAVAFSPDGTRLVSAGDNHALRLWDTRSGKQIGAALKGHKDDVMHLVFSPDGARIVSGSIEGPLRSWDARTGRQLGDPLADKYSSAITVSPDGKRILGDSSTHALLLWDVTRGVLFEKLSAEGTDRLVLGSPALSPDGKLIATAGHTGLWLWDVESGRHIAGPLEGTTGSLAFSRDGRYLVGTSNNGQVLLWDAPLLQSGPRLLALLCEAAHRNLTREEWRHYVPATQEYREICKGLPSESAASR